MTAAIAGLGALAGAALGKAIAGSPNPIGADTSVPGITSATIQQGGKNNEQWQVAQADPTQAMSYFQNAASKSQSFYTQGLGLYTTAINQALSAQSAGLQYANQQLAPQAYAAQQAINEELRFMGIDPMSSTQGYDSQIASQFGQYSPNVSALSQAITAANQEKDPNARAQMLNQINGQFGTVKNDILNYGLSQAPAPNVPYGILFNGMPGVGSNGAVTDFNALNQYLNGWQSLDKNGGLSQAAYNAYGIDANGVQMQRFGSYDNYLAAIKQKQAQGYSTYDDMPSSYQNGAITHGAQLPNQVFDVSTPQGVMDYLNSSKPTASGLPSQNPKMPGVYGAAQNFDPSSASSDTIASGAYAKSTYDNAKSSVQKWIDDYNSWKTNTSAQNSTNQALAGQLQAVQSQFDSAYTPNYDSGYTGAQVQQKLEAMPGYQAQLNMGTENTARSAAAKGMLSSGNTLGAIQQFGQNLADTTYQQVLGNLASIASQGLPASQQIASNYTQSANNTSQLYTDLGNAGATTYGQIGNQYANAYTNQGQAFVNESMFNAQQQNQAIAQNHAQQSQQQIAAMQSGAGYMNAQTAANTLNYGIFQGQQGGQAFYGGGNGGGSGYNILPIGGTISNPGSYASYGLPQGFTL